MQHLQGLWMGIAYTSSLNSRVDTTCMCAESPQHRLSRASYAASEGCPASSTDGHLESASDSMGYWTINGAAQEHSQPQPHSLGNELLYGLINTCVSIPAMISFAAIIFQVQICFASLKLPRCKYCVGPFPSRLSVQGKSSDS